MSSTPSRHRIRRGERTALLRILLRTLHRPVLQQMQQQDQRRKFPRISPLLTYRLNRVLNFRTAWTQLESISTLNASNVPIAANSSATARSSSKKDCHTVKRVSSIPRVEFKRGDTAEFHFSFHSFTTQIGTSCLRQNVSRADSQSKLEIAGWRPWTIITTASVSTARYAISARMLLEINRSISREENGRNVF